jgi:hypothetical protein
MVVVIVLIAVEVVNVAAVKVKNLSKFAICVKKCESPELQVVRTEIFVM